MHVNAKPVAMLRGTRTRGRRGFGPGETGDQSWDLLLVCVAVYLVTSVGRVHLMFGVLEVLRPVLVSGLVALALYVLTAHPARRFEALRAAPTTFLVALAVWMALSVPGSLREARSFEFLTDDFLKSAMVSYVLIVGTVRSMRDVERFAFLYFLSAAIYSAVVIARFGGRSASWRLSELYTYDANDFAVLAVSAVPLAVYFLAGRRRSLVLRLVLLLGLSAIGITFVWAGSRGGLVALGVVIVFMLSRYQAIPIRWRLLAAGVLVLTLLAVGSAQYWMQMRTMIEPAGDYNLTEDTGRLQIWRRGLGYMMDRPVFGVGPDNFEVAEGVLSPLAWRQNYGMGVRWAAPHNSLIQVGAELGIPGLLLFMAFVASVLQILHRVGRHAGLPNTADSPDPRALAQGITGALVGFLVGALFLSLAYSVMLYVLAALAVALGKVTIANGVIEPSGFARRNQ